MKKVFLGLILTLIFGGALTVNAQRTQEITLRKTRQTSVMNDRLRLKLVSVEDSRCPRGTQCVWAGSAKVTIKAVNRNGKSQTFVLNTLRGDRSARFGGFEITLVDVNPYPATNIRINPNGYTAKVTVEKL